MDEVRVHTPKAVTHALPKDRGPHAEFVLGLKLAFPLSTGRRAQQPCLQLFTSESLLHAQHSSSTRENVKKLLPT